MGLAYSRFMLGGLGLVIFLGFWLVTSQLFKGRWVTGLTSFLIAAVLMVAMDWWAPKPPALTPGKERTKFLSKIDLIKSLGVIVQNHESKQVGLVVNTFYKNTGSLAAVGVTRNCYLNIVSTPLTTDQERAYQDDLLKQAWNPARQEDQTQPGEQRFFTVPDNDVDISRVAVNAPLVISGEARLYLFVAQKYRDESLPQNIVNVTEYCGWFSGSRTNSQSDLEVRHVCGRNRVFEENTATTSGASGAH